MDRLDLVDCSYMEEGAGENSEHEIGITLPVAETDAIEELPPRLKDGMSQDVFLARAIARTQNMGK